MGLTGATVFTGLGLAAAPADAVVAATLAVVGATEVGEPAAEAAALLAAADANGELATGLDAAEITDWLAGAELWCVEWLHAALRPASAAIMVAVAAVLGVRLMLYLRPARPRSEATPAPDSARAQSLMVQMTAPVATI